MRLIITAEPRVRQGRPENTPLGTVRVYTTNGSSVLHTCSSKLHFCKLRVVVIWNCQSRTEGVNTKSPFFTLSSPSPNRYFCLPLSYFKPPQKLMDHWSEVRGLLVNYFGTWMQNKLAGCSFGYVLALHIPQVWHRHTIAQEALSDLGWAEG